MKQTYQWGRKVSQILHSSLQRSSTPLQLRNTSLLFYRKKKSSFTKLSRVLRKDRSQIYNLKNYLAMILKLKAFLVKVRFVMFIWLY